MSLPPSRFPIDSVSGAPGPREPERDENHVPGRLPEVATEESGVPPNTPAAPPGALAERLTALCVRAPTLRGVRKRDDFVGIRVWAPDFWRIWFPVVIGLLVCVAEFFVYEPLRRFLPRPLADLPIFGAVFTLTTAHRVWRTPCVVAVDENGIAVNTRSGSRAFLWREIAFFKVEAGYFTPIEMIVLHVPESVRLHLWGHSLRARRELLKMLCHHVPQRSDHQLEEARAWRQLAAGRRKNSPRT